MCVTLSLSFYFKRNHFFIFSFFFFFSLFPLDDGDDASASPWHGDVPVDERNEGREEGAMIEGLGEDGTEGQVRILKSPLCSAFI